MLAPYTDFSGFNFSSITKTVLFGKVTAVFFCKVDACDVDLGMSGIKVWRKALIFNFAEITCKPNRILIIFAEKLAGNGKSHFE
jgi:hypothetical protein